MKTANQILKDLIADFTASTERVTYFGKDGVLRAIFHALSYVIADIWNDLYQVTRRVFADYSTGTDLDNYASRRGITRKTASKSSVVLLFNGTADTVIPAGTVVQSNLSQEKYVTQAEVTLGTANPAITGFISNNNIGDVVIAESLNSGKSSAVGVMELTQFETPIAGVTVTNLTPSIGGEDSESDTSFRERIKNYITLLNQGTQPFYEAITKEVETTAHLVKATYDPARGGVKLYLVKNSFANYTDEELLGIAELVYEKQRACNPVLCLNASRQSIQVQFRYTRGNRSQADIYADIASKISGYVIERQQFAGKILFQDILNIIIDTDGVERLDLRSLLVNGRTVDVVCSSFQIPVFTYLKITSTTSLYSSITQSIP